MLISHISGFLQEVLCPFISGTKHELRSLKFTVFAGCQIWVKFTRKTRPRGGDGE